MRHKKSKLHHMLHHAGDTTARYADRLGCRTRALTRRVGPKRGSIALGVLATAVGLRYLVRFLKMRHAQQPQARDAWSPIYG